MAYTTNTAFFAALKQYYNNQRIVNMVYANRPLLAKITKDTSMGGYTVPVPIINALGTAPGSSLSTVAANQQPMTVNSFLIAVATGYNLATISGVTIAASRGAGARSFLDATRAEIDGKFQAISNYLANSLVWSGTGSIATIGSQVAANGITYGGVTYTNGIAITLGDIGGVVNFELGYQIEYRATDGAASPDTTVGTVIAVDRMKGVVTVGNASTGFSNWTNGGYLNVQGNSVAGASLGAAPTAANSAIVPNIVGLAGWIPSGTVASTDSFWGVNRSPDRTRLAGFVFDASQMPIQEGLVQVLAVMWREGARPDAIFLNPLSWAALEKSYEGKQTIMEDRVAVDKSGGSTYFVGFKALKLNHPGGVIDCYSDPYIPGKTAYILQLENVKLHSMGPAPQVTRNPDGLEFLRVAASSGDAFETRMHFYAQMGINAPGHCAYVALQA